MSKKILLITLILCLALALCACGSQDPAASAAQAEEEPSVNYQVLQGTTGVTTAETTATSCFSFSYMEDPEDSTSTDLTWFDCADQSLPQGTIVVVLNAGETECQVYIPREEFPGVYGTIPSSLVSYDQELIFSGSVAMASDDAVFYSAPDYNTSTGQQVGAGVVWIEERQEGWYRCSKETDAGSVSLWIPSECLSFDFSGEYIYPLS